MLNSCLYDGRFLNLQYKFLLNRFGIHLLYMIKETIPNTILNSNIFTTGQALIITDGAILGAAFDAAVNRLIAAHDAALRDKAEEEELVEQHAAAQMIGKDVRTLRRWSKAGVIDAVVPPSGRPIYYKKSQLQRIMNGFVAPRRNSHE